MDNDEAAKIRFLAISRYPSTAGDLAGIVNG
jgi:hypothetical protein